MRFDTWMREALYAPGLGYYSAGSAKLGEAGDFTTAPEISPIFGQCLARQLAELLPQLDGQILELGPGSGRLAHDVLTELDALGVPPASYQLLEPSADLRERQASLLTQNDLAGRTRLEWLDEPPKENWRGVVLANEVLDALPVRCFEVTGAAGVERLLERGVRLSGDGFAWASRPATPDLVAAVTTLETALGRPLPTGYQSEYCPDLADWLASVLQTLECGAVFFSDYGLPRAAYYLPERATGTLICHYRHRAHNDPFLYPGLQDISAWVDFTAVAEAGVAAGWRLAGFTTQAHFLIGAGLDEVLASYTADSNASQFRRASEVRTLTLPGEMGERFKFMALMRGLDVSLRGFSFRDMRDKL